VLSSTVIKTTRLEIQAQALIASMPISNTQYTIEWLRERTE